MVDALGEGSGLVRRLAHGGIDALDVSMSGLGAAVALVRRAAPGSGGGGSGRVRGGERVAARRRRWPATPSVPVWVAAGVGRLLPRRMWDSLEDRRATRAADPWDLDEEIVPLSLVDAVVGPAGPQAPDDALRRTDCPVAPELLDPGHAPGTYRQ